VYTGFLRLFLPIVQIVSINILFFVWDAKSAYDAYILLFCCRSIQSKQDISPHFNFHVKQESFPPWQQLAYY
jgi:hypothetical protein